MRVSGRARTSLVAAVTFVLVAQPAAAACTGIMLKTKDGSILHGRMVEFGITIDTSIAVVPRDYTFVGQTPKGDGLKYTSKYAAVGAIAFTGVKLLDGLNEAGLAMARLL
jgi:choloylglycine hydrolase